MAQYTWGDFLRAAMKHHVTLDWIEEDGLTEEGEPFRTRIIVRVLPSGERVSWLFGDRSTEDRIDWRDARQITNLFGLPYEEFKHFAEDRSKRW